MPKKEDSQETSIVPCYLAIKAMRDAGYKNTAYAVAELIDNSIQANAKNVKLFCGYKEEQTRTKVTKKLVELAVLDDGDGMDDKTLIQALRFGDGTHLDETNQKGIGKFGMGLPNSSISQALRVDVWTWQNGVEKAIHTYLDINEIKNDKYENVPKPKKDPLSEHIRAINGSFGKTGTLVRWTKLDKVIWKTPGALIKNSEALIGRIYRKFLKTNKVEISMITYDTDDPNNNLQIAKARPNDPLYLMEGTSTPEPYDKVPLFKHYFDHECECEFHGKKHKVKTVYSYAKEDARRDDLSGNKPYGKHAARNIGVSIMRADRELELDTTLLSGYDPVDRWWGIEVSFPPELDEVFGVTNNKQYARHFTEVCSIFKDDAIDINQTRIDWKEEDDVRGPLWEVVKNIRDNIKAMKEMLHAQTAGVRRRNRYTTGSEDEGTLKTATEATKHRQEQGHKGTSDLGEELSNEQKETEVRDALIEGGATQETAEDLSARTVRSDLKYVFTDGVIEGTAFFAVRPQAGKLIVTLNTSHNAYKALLEVLEKEIDPERSEEVLERLIKAREGLRLVLLAWARFEDEEPEGQRKMNAQNARAMWGRIALEFMEDWHSK